MAKKLENKNTAFKMEAGGFLPDPETGAQDSPAADLEKEREKYTKRVQVLFTEAEHDTLRRLAYTHNKKYSDIIRDALKNTYEEFN